MTERHVRPADWRERLRAVDITLSCIVQAPAGSGKTELLVQRILALLAVADAPEEILAITFTRKAAAEMKQRLLQALERGRIDQPPESPHAADTWQRARAVLARDGALDWKLLQNPSRLQLMTIDSFNALLVRRMPWVARFGDQPRVSEAPEELYLLAAEALLARLESGGAGQPAIERLLVHLDNRLALLRDLLVAMLGRRDQWLRHLMARRTGEPRQLLESGLQLYVSTAVQRAEKVLGSEVCSELDELAAFAAANLLEEVPEHPLARLANTPAGVTRTHDDWQALTQIILTVAGEVRKSVSKAVGFPADKTPHAQTMKGRALALLDRIREDQDAIEALLALRRLPATSYTNGQWQILEALIELLPLAVVELQDTFRSRGLVDFIEIAGAARAALGSSSSPEELLLQLDGRLRHLLIDEFQDTSFAQYDLLRSLTAGWTPGDGRTLFVVGDPMQSIYRFREAEVGLYLRVCQRGLDSLPMERVVLNTNFRSCKPLVDWANGSFAALFPASEDEVRGAVQFAPAVAFNSAEGGPAVSMHGFVGRRDADEAQAVVEIVRRAMQERPDDRVAVLVRSRNHLVAIVAALKKAGLVFQAQDIDPLINRPVVRDILSLARALQHPADRVAWLAVLRAPWCGLSLHDMAALCGRDARATVWQLLTEPANQHEMFEQISCDGMQRLQRILPALEHALQNRGRVSLRRLVESSWLAMHGPACISEGDLLDVRQVFALLDEVDSAEPLENLEQRLSRLFAVADPAAGPQLQLMTIHKAKGLEFDTVILPGLGRGVRSRERALLRWLEHPDYELLLAPIPPLAGDPQEPTYQAIGRLLQEKDDHESLRLLYVAVTRARTRLHLLGHAKPDRTGQLAPQAGSLLALLWPVCSQGFPEEGGGDTCQGETAATTTLRRLPLLWRAPQLAEPLTTATSAVQLASMSGHYRDERIKTRRTEEGRAVGTLVHYWLDRIAGDGVERWPERLINALPGVLRGQLSAQGIPDSRLKACTSSVLGCLRATVGSPRGRWLMARHRDAANELAINGIVDDQLVHAVIDRTFVCQDNIRWIIDYKTSEPSSGVSREEHMALEAARYDSQLRLYVNLMQQFKDDGLTVRPALYFPSFDGWFEVDC